MQGDQSHLVEGITPGFIRYISTKKHRHSTTNDHNKWRKGVNAVSQQKIAAIAVVGRFSAPDGSHWGACESLPTLGTEPRQRMAFFPPPKNPNDPEHGYPISALDPKRLVEHTPPIAVIDGWREAGIVSEIDAIRLSRGKI